MAVTDPAQPAAADARLQALTHWLGADLGRRWDRLVPVSGDASFRRYFRLSAGDSSWVVMDAPPAQETCDEFVAIARRLHGLGLNVPEIVAADLEQGFLLLTDLGGRHYLDELTAASAGPLYHAAMDALARLQSRGLATASSLPPYDRALLQREMSLFPDWLLSRHLGLGSADQLAGELAPAFELLTQAALEQPRVWVHRDYHSRNLMVTAEAAPGVLDFQDAVYGPITYDLVSLLKDCYIAWPREQVEAWALEYYRRPEIRALLGPVGEAQWLRWFDLMGVQRHLKASGIFARLWHRDGKRGYLKDIPRTVGYIAEVTERHAELASLHRLLVDEVLPRLEAEGA